MERMSEWGGGGEVAGVVPSGANSGEDGAAGVAADEEAETDFVTERVVTLTSGRKSTHWLRQVISQTGLKVEKANPRAELADPMVKFAHGQRTAALPPAGSLLEGDEAKPIPPMLAGDPVCRHLGL
jgi:hypothetical protein